MAYASVPTYASAKAVGRAQHATSIVASNISTVKIAVFVSDPTCAIVRTVGWLQTVCKHLATTEITAQGMGFASDRTGRPV